MFRGTAAFLVIVLVLNHELALGRNIEPIPKSSVSLEKREAVPSNELETVSEKSHSRHKRSWGALFRGTLAVAAAGSFSLSVGSTIYHAIRRCKDYTPKPCRDPICIYLSPCPNVCHGPDTNRRYANDQKTIIRQTLDNMDSLQLRAFNLASYSIRASILNQRILTEIDRINDMVDQIMFDLVDMDINLAEKFRNQSVALKTLLRNERLTLTGVIVSPEMQGIFDKWSWEGTGTFALSIAIPVGLQLFKSLRERYAIHKLYKEMKVDFSNRFLNQKAKVNPNSIGQAKLHNKFAYVQGYSTKNIKLQLKQAAKATYYANKADVKTTRIQSISKNVVGPALNLVVTALSAWQTYVQISACQEMANTIQDNAVTITEQKDKIEGIKQTQLLPLLHNISTQSWAPVKKLLTNETFTGWLEGIRNLTLGANDKEITAANTIQDFINNIESADEKGTIVLQNSLAAALSNIKFEFSCLADKTHAIAIVLRDCRLGKNEFSALYEDANSKFKLNRKTCVDQNMIPYTTPTEFLEIINKTAARQNWYSNCLLNDNDLLIRVCSEKLKGFNPLEIVKRVNKSALTVDMVNNFLTRCPPPEITPKGRQDTCKLYCLYDTPAEIAKSVALLLSQVNEIIKNCSICSVRSDQKLKICTLRFCNGKNSTTIEAAVRLPLPTVNDVINKCVQKCVLTNEQKKVICLQRKCQDYSPSEIEKNVGLTLKTVNEVITECSTIVPSCGPVSSEDISRITLLRCTFKYSALQIFMLRPRFVQLPLERIESVFASSVCPPAPALPNFG